MRKRIQEFKFEIRARAENVVVVGVEDTAQFRRLIDIIAGAAFCHEQGLNTRSVRMWRLGCPAVNRTEAIVIAVSGSPFRGTLCFWPRILRGNGPQVFRCDSADPISRPDRELVAALCRAICASEGWL